MSLQKKFLLAMHDVGILHFEKTRDFVDRLFQRTQKPFSLLIIPDLSSAGEEEKKIFLLQLKKWEQQGFEFLLHGSSHRADPEFTRSFKGKMALKLTHQEAEFAGLAEKDSENQLKKALQSWQNLGLKKKPVGFVPPTWHSNPFLKKQVLTDLMWYEERFFLYRKEGKIFSPAVSFAGIPKIALPLAQVYSKTCALFPISCPRLALHPLDIDLFGEGAFKIISDFFKRREQVFYGDIGK